MAAAVVNAFWIGPMLGPVHAACLRSFARHGHRVLLHAFEPPGDAPDCVEHFDALQLMRKDEVIRHRRRASFTLAADRYRYRILREGLGVYVDCDMYCVKPLPEREYLLGWESNTHVNNAILYAPSGSRLVSALLDAAEDDGFIPPWESAPRRRLMQALRLVGTPLPLSMQRWGTIGPKLITHCVKELGLASVCSPIDMFYPMHFGLTGLLFDPGLRIADLVTPRTHALHLYSSSLAGRPLVDGSPLHQMVLS